MKIMTYLDPRQTVWPGVITAACLATILMTVGQSSAIIVTAVVAWLCMVWWIFEPIPIPVTSLLPLSVLPMAGSLNGRTGCWRRGLTADYPIVRGDFCSLGVWRARGRTIGSLCRW